jgi:hypothetical protein
MLVRFSVFRPMLLRLRLAHADRLRLQQLHRLHRLLRHRPLAHHEGADPQADLAVDVH